MVKSSRKDLDFEHGREQLKNFTARVRSTRPLVHLMPSYTITQLRQWGLLQIGQANCHAFDEEYSLVTTLASKRTTLRVRIQKREFVITLVSRPLGKGLVWYFRDPLSSRLVKSVYLSKEGFIIGRKAAGGLYASQFQSKSYRELLRMDQLILDIDGDRNGRIGPARGASKLKKLQDLSRIFSNVRAADREREKVLAKFPQLYKTIGAANILLKRELGKSHKSWVPAQKVNVPGHYSTNGLDVIPRSAN
jgi:hypothetical protein